MREWEQRNESFAWRSEESFVRRTEGEAPLIRVVENKERGLFEAQFSMMLNGVICLERDPKDPAPDTRGQETLHYLSSLLEGMGLDQSLTVLCSVARERRKGVRHDWNIVGTAGSATKEDAVEDSMALFESVSAVLKTMHREYQFAADKDEAAFERASPGGRWSAVIEPDTLVLVDKPRGPVGFLGEPGNRSASRGLVLPTMHSAQGSWYLDALYRANAGGHIDSCLRLDFFPLFLDAREQEMVRTFLRRVKEGKAVMRRGMDAKAEPFDGKKHVERLLHTLELWNSEPAGYRVRCVVESERPLPTSLLSMIGREVFRDRIRVRGVRPDHGGSGSGDSNNGLPEDVLNLCGCFHRDAAMPPILPSARLLHESGLRRQYSNVGLAYATEGILLGRFGNNEDSDRVCYPRKDRAKHCYVIGATGTGKSTLLYHMIMQDIRDGEGVTVIDPHGDLYRQVLESMPSKRYGDVVLVNPCDFEYSVGINFLECGAGPFRSVRMNFIINEMIRIFDRLYDLKQTGGPMFEQYMRNALALLMEAEPDRGTLVDVPLIFEDRRFRKQLIEKCSNQFVNSFWLNQAQRAGGEASLENIAPYITSKLNQFTTNGLMRPIIGQMSSTIDFWSILDEGKILLVNLSKGLLGELDTQLLGMLIIGKVFSSAMARVAVPMDRRRQMFLYVDEFQNFTTDSVAHMLSESRKFGISLTLANQNLSQLQSSYGRNSVLDSVLGNVGTMLMLRMGVLDAERMQTYVKPTFNSSDLQELPDFHVIARMLVNGFPHRPFVFNTMAMPKMHGHTDMGEVVGNLRKRYAKPIAEVESQINQRLKQSME